MNNHYETKIKHHKNKTKAKNKFMDQLHNKLLEKSPWYAAWHQEPTSQKLHWTAFIIVVFVVGVVLLNRIDVRGLESDAAANGAKVLVVYNAGYTVDSDKDGTQDSLQV